MSLLTPNLSDRPRTSKAPKRIAVWYYVPAEDRAPLMATHMRTISCEQMISAGGATAPNRPRNTISSTGPRCCRVGRPGQDT